MNNYYIKVILLEGCPYSINLEKLMEQNKIIHKKFIRVNHSNKHLYKSDLINTFPQVYLNKYNSKGNLLLGGYEDFNNFIKIFKNNALDSNKINNFMKIKNWSKRATIRLIQLIN